MANELQEDEIEAMAAMYPDQWVCLDEAARVFCVTVAPLSSPLLESGDISSPAVTSLCLRLILPKDYPERAPPMYELSPPWDTRAAEATHIAEQLNTLYQEQDGGPVLFAWCQWLEDYLAEWKANEAAVQAAGDEQTEAVAAAVAEAEAEAEAAAAEGNDAAPVTSTSRYEHLATLVHGETITDRKSVFQAHVGRVDSQEEVNAMMQVLLEDRKIARATHNILAYRINMAGRLLQDCDDDGESAAGSRLLHLLQIIDVQNTAVVVTRWYGGIHLGPDRFKHINNAARNGLELAGLAEPSTKRTKGKKPK